MDLARFLAVFAAFARIALLYRSLPQNLSALSLAGARWLPGDRAGLRHRIERELGAYRALLADPAAFQSQALHLQALIVLSGVMTLLFAASQTVQTRADPAIAPFFPPADAVLGLFFLFSLAGLRLAVFHSWMFLHKVQNLRRLECTMAILGDTTREKPA